MGTTYTWSATARYSGRILDSATTVFLVKSLGKAPATELQASRAFAAPDHVLEAIARDLDSPRLDRPEAHRSPERRADHVARFVAPCRGECSPGCLLHRRLHFQRRTMDRFPREIERQPPPLSTGTGASASPANLSTALLDDRQEAQAPVDRPQNLQRRIDFQVPQEKLPHRQDQRHLSQNQVNRQL